METKHPSKHDPVAFAKQMKVYDMAAMLDCDTLTDFMGYVYRGIDFKPHRGARNSKRDMLCNLRTALKGEPLYGSQSQLAGADLDQVAIMLSRIMEHAALCKQEVVEIRKGERTFRRNCISETFRKLGCLD